MDSRPPLSETAIGEGETKVFAMYRRRLLLVFLVLAVALHVAIMQPGMKFVHHVTLAALIVLAGVVP